MQPDSHPGPTHSRDNATAAHAVNATSRLRPVRSSVAALVGIFGLTALPLLSCGDEDSTGLIARGGSSGASGSAGRAGSAGSAGRGGSGGSSGNAGNAGNAGAAGNGGSGGSSFDGDAIATTICTTMGQLAGTGDPDAGADGGAPDGGDAGPAAATGCSPTATCTDQFSGPDGLFTFIQSGVPACVDEMEAYFGCIATQPATAYECDPGSGLPIISLGNHGCVAEEGTFYAGLADATTCE